MIRLKILRFQITLKKKDRNWKIKC